MKIVFINVVLEGDYQYEQEIPLGIASLMAFLRKHNYDVICQQCFAGRDDAQISLATRIEADIYCFQLNTVNYQAVKTVVKEIKIKRPTSYAIFGGPFLISLSEKILKNEPLYDFIVFGEGEATLLELLRAIERPKSDFSNINGLVWRKESGEVVTNKPRELIEDLDTLPFPARDFLEDGKLDPRDNGLIESVRLVSSRGCIGRCSFCCVNLYNKFQKGRAWRGRSPKNVVDEIEYLSKTFNAKLFNFSDSSFDDPGKLGKIRSRQICEEIISRKIPFSAKIYLRCETMKSSDDIELLKLYKKAGIDIIIIGAESGSDYELKLYDKPAGVEDNYRTVRILEDLGLFYVMSGFIMFGPNSTLETLRSNIEFLYRGANVDPRF
ncbi:MAG: radical SAM protein [Candidatus Omnitrophica bacterium]|nr:radical SAM protein [Candidatus Omnitrophota bacterium]